MTGDDDPLVPSQNSFTLKELVPQAVDKKEILKIAPFLNNFSSEDTKAKAYV